MPPDNPNKIIENMDYSGGVFRFQLASLIRIGPSLHTETVITNLRCRVVVIETDEKAIQLSDMLLVLSCFLLERSASLLSLCTLASQVSLK